MGLHSEHNRLFFNDKQMVEWACGQDCNPAHHQRIRCTGASPKNTRIISVDDGVRMAVAVGQVVTIYTTPPNNSPLKVEEVPLSLKGKIVLLCFTDDDHVLCYNDEGHVAKIGRNPEWIIM